MTISEVLSRFIVKDHVSVKVLRLEPRYQARWAQAPEGPWGLTPEGPAVQMPEDPAAQLQKGPHSSIEGMWSNEATAQADAFQAVLAMRAKGTFRVHRSDLESTSSEGSAAGTQQEAVQEQLVRIADGATVLLLVVSMVMILCEEGCANMLELTHGHLHTVMKTAVLQNQMCLANINRLKLLCATASDSKLTDCIQAVESNFLQLGLQHVPHDLSPADWLISPEVQHQPHHDHVFRTLGAVVQRLYRAIQIHSLVCYLTSPCKHLLLLLSYRHCSPDVFRDSQHHRMHRRRRSVPCQCRCECVTHRLPVQKSTQKKRSVGHLPKPLVSVLPAILNSRSHSRATSILARCSSHAPPECQRGISVDNLEIADLVNASQAAAVWACMHSHECEKVVIATLWAAYLHTLMSRKADKLATMESFAITDSKQVPFAPHGSTAMSELTVESYDWINKHIDVLSIQREGSKAHLCTLMANMADEAVFLAKKVGTPNHRMFKESVQQLAITEWKICRDMLERCDMTQRSLEDFSRTSTCAAVMCEKAAQELLYTTRMPSIVITVVRATLFVDCVAC